MTSATSRGVLRHRSVVITVLLLVIWGAFLAWSSWVGGQKLSAADFASAREGRLHIAVTLDFAPEAFHMEIFQEIGRLIEVRGETAYLMDVKGADARWLARRYWIKAIRPWPGR